MQAAPTEQGQPLPQVVYCQGEIEPYLDTDPRAGLQPALQHVPGLKLTQRRMWISILVCVVLSLVIATVVGIIEGMRKTGARAGSPKCVESSADSTLEGSPRS